MARTSSRRAGCKAPREAAPAGGCSLGSSPGPACPGKVIWEGGSLLATTTSCVTPGQQHWPFLPVLTLRKRLRGVAVIQGPVSHRSRLLHRLAQRGCPCSPGSHSAEAFATLTSLQVSGQGAETLQKGCGTRPRPPASVAGPGLARPSDRGRGGQSRPGPRPGPRSDRPGGARQPSPVLRPWPQY